VRDVIRRALDLGIRTFDTSPYYDPSEILLGEAFSHPDIANKYTRKDYILMAKIGRIAASHSDYPPDWVQHLVRRPPERSKTPYPDVVFCHDIEYVIDEGTTTAMGVLWEFVATGQIRNVGISEYPIDKLVRVCTFGPGEIWSTPDVVQNWAQLTLQNMWLKREGLAALQDASVGCICSSSPLVIGLLRS
jgi:D-arabinose 1-dehydrogenase